MVNKCYDDDLKRKIDRAAELELSLQAARLELFLAERAMVRARSSEDFAAAKKVYDKLKCDRKTEAMTEKESDLLDIMRTSGGTSLLHWERQVRASWWYKIFSRLDPAMREIEK